MVYGTVTRRKRRTVGRQRSLRPKHLRIGTFTTRARKISSRMRCGSLPSERECQVLHGEDAENVSVGHWYPFHEYFLPPTLMVTKQEFAPLEALTVGTQGHTSPEQFGKVMSLVKPRLMSLGHPHVETFASSIDPF